MTAPTRSLGLRTDRYELTMLDAFRREGRADVPAVFEVFARGLPPSFRYGVFAGLGRLLPMIEEFGFDADDLDWLLAEGIVSEATAEHLAGYRFTGTVRAYDEGDLYFPSSPVLAVSGTLGECVVLETLILSVLNFDTAVASKASRMVNAAQGRPLIEMGSRRTNEDAAVAAARAAYLAGFASTSNLLAGRRHGVPTQGTVAHAFMLAHRDEASAFAAQIDAQGAGTTLLVDTYDVEAAVATAVRVAREVADVPGPGAVRIDSGDLATVAARVRAQLDDLGATSTRIVVTSDLDEHVIKDLATGPVDAFGVGTRLVSTPPAGFVYKLVSVSDGDAMRAVAKRSDAKVDVAGEKFPWRVSGPDGALRDELFTTDRSQLPSEDDRVRHLQRTVIAAGRRVGEVTLEEARLRHERARAELPSGEKQVWHGDFGPLTSATLSTGNGTGGLTR